MKELRTYQSRSVDFLAAHSRALVVCPAGGGKTIIGAAALARVAKPGSRVGWACNTREQGEQGEAALKAFGVVPEWVKCVAGLAPADVAGLDFLVMDEAHHLPSASWSRLGKSCPGAIWGLTATPDSPDKDRNKVFYDFWQGNVFKVRRSEVMEGGHLASGIVFIRDIDAPSCFDSAIKETAKVDTDKLMRRCRWLKREEMERRALYRATVDALIGNDLRNQDIIQLALSEMADGQSVLVLVAQVEHGQQLAEKIPGSVAVYAKIGAKKRKEAIEGFRDGSLKCMIATSLADEGLDVPRASVLILASVGRSARLVEQRTGRVMRPHESKERGVIYDYADRGAAMAHWQHLARLRIYRKLGYEIQSD